MPAPRRRNPKPYTPAKDPLLTAQEALNIAVTMDTWPGSYARVLKDGKPLEGGYKPFYPPPVGCVTWPVVQLHEERRAGRPESNYYGQHLEAFYVMRDSLAPLMGMGWDEWHDWYNWHLRNAPQAIAIALRWYAEKYR